jgi:hypothetical protein
MTPEADSFLMYRADDDGGAAVRDHGLKLAERQERADAGTTPTHLARLPASQLMTRISRANLQRRREIGDERVFKRITTGSAWYKTG